MSEPTTTEIVFRYQSGREDVHYRRPYGSDEAKAMMKEVDQLPEGTSYFYRHVPTKKEPTMEREGTMLVQCPCGWKGGIPAPALDGMRCPDCGRAGLREIVPEETNETVQRKSWSNQRGGVLGND